MEIKILGSGCSNCMKLEERSRDAVKQLQIAATFMKVQDYKEIVSYGVMKTPALVIDNQVKVMGRVPSVEELKTLLGKSIQ